LFVVAPIIIKMTAIAIRADQTGCRRGQGHLIPGGEFFGDDLEGRPPDPDGWPRGIDMGVPPLFDGDPVEFS
jgi:hypothetical protein